MKKLVLVRGLPGSGKTTYAKKMLDNISGEGKPVKWLESSMYFTTLRIKFTKPEQSNVADKWIKAEANKALVDDCTVIVSNVAGTVDAISQWKDIADKHNAEFDIIRLNTHWEDKWPPFVHDAMAKHFEDYAGETVISPEQQ